MGEGPGFDGAPIVDLEGVFTSPFSSFALMKTNPDKKSISAIDKAMFFIDASFYTFNEAPRSKLWGVKHPSLRL